MATLSSSWAALRATLSSLLTHGYSLSLLLHSIPLIRGGFFLLSYTFSSSSSSPIPSSRNLNPAYVFSAQLVCYWYLYLLITINWAQGHSESYLLTFSSLSTNLGDPKLALEYKQHYANPLQHSMIHPLPYYNWRHVCKLQESRGELAICFLVPKVATMTEG